MSKNTSTLKIYNLSYPKGKVRFALDEVQAVIPSVIPSSTGTTSPPTTVGIEVCLTNGHRYQLRAEYGEELLAIFEED